jgi:hypothetical protein
MSSTSAHGPSCWCCGEERTEDQLARLQCHDEVALCARCVGWLAARVTDAAPGPVLRDATPIIATTDLSRALLHYEALGFDVHAYPGGGYGFVRRGGIELHVAEHADLDKKSNPVAVYIEVSDADALWSEWSASGVGGSLVAPVDQDYGLREGEHVDPDGNALRFGSPIP